MAVSIKAYVEPSAKALEQGRDCEYSLWLLLRFLDPDGNARVKLKDLRRLIDAHGLFRWGNKAMSEARLQRRLERGAGTFWTIDDDCQETKVIYSSLGAVCEALQVLPYRRPVAVPLRAFATLRSARSFLYSAALSSVRGRTLSRQTITRMTGISKRTQRRYEKASGIEKHRNLATEPWTFERGREVPAGGFLVKHRNGAVSLRRPMPNTYLTSLTQLAYGQVRRVRREGRGIVEAMPSVLKRRYFAEPKAAKRCDDKQQPYFVDTHREWHGQRVWAANYA